MCRQLSTINYFILIPFSGESRNITQLLLADIIPKTEHYMTYEGSLTQPGCQETVTWIVLNKPIYVTKGQVRYIFCLLLLFGDNSYNGGWRKKSLYQTIIRHLQGKCPGQKWPLEIVSLNDARAISVINGGFFARCDFQKITTGFFHYLSYCDVSGDTKREKHRTTDGRS